MIAGLVKIAGRIGSRIPADRRSPHPLWLGQSATAKKVTELGMLTITADHRAGAGGTGGDVEALRCRTGPSWRLASAMVLAGMSYIHTQRTAFSHRLLLPSSAYVGIEFLNSVIISMVCIGLVGLSFLRYSLAPLVSPSSAVTTGNVWANTGQTARPSVPGSAPFGSLGSYSASPPLVWSNVRIGFSPDGVPRRLLPLALRLGEFRRAD